MNFKLIEEDKIISLENLALIHIASFNHLHAGQKGRWRETNDRMTILFSILGFGDASSSILVVASLGVSIFKLLLMTEY